MKKPPTLRSPADPAFSYKTYPFYLLSRASGQYNVQMESALKARGLDQGQWRILLVLMEHDSIGVARLAEKVVFKLSTTTRIIQRLEKAGFISSIQSAQDARIKNVSITPAGKAAVEASRAAAAAVFNQAFEGLDARTVEAFCKALEHIDAALLGGAAS